MNSTVKYYFKDIPKNETKDKQKHKYLIEVYDGDCFQAARLYKNSVIHNFANNTRPGGPTSKFGSDGIIVYQKEGSDTQEDQIIRLYGKDILLFPGMYPIIDESKPDMEALLYSTCGAKHPVITLPGPIGPNFQNKKIIRTIMNRIRLLLYVAYKHSHTLITGLWGCGAFACDPKDMIQLWDACIKTSDYVPERIVFAILMDEYSEKWGKKEDMINIFKKI